MTGDRPGTPAGACAAAPVDGGARPLGEWRYRDGRWSEAPAALAVELPVALEYNGIAHAVMLATPLDLEDFALGFSLSEGIVERASDVYEVEHVPGAGGHTLRVRIAAGAFAGLKERRRSLAGRTGCGICGTESLDQVLRPIVPLAMAPTRLAAVALAQATAQLPAAQPLQQQTGATHGAVWCDWDGTIRVAREDVGRHNALDKLIGALLRGRTDTAEGFALITSRASVEMVQKAATAGISVLAAVSGPTTLAVQTAQRCGLTLIGFARGRNFAVYTHRARLADAA